MSFTAAFAFDLATGEPAEPSSAFAAAIGSLAPGDCLDMGAPKPEAEWLLAGRAFAPGGAPAARTAVKAQVGESRRTLLVEAREPFVSAPLTWRDTWGSDAENPEGPRAGKGEKAAVCDEALPYGAPACMGPRGAWPCRMGRMGTYDGKWLRECWPGVPGDFDWGFYNLSQPAQRLPKGLRGGETIALVNLNKDFPALETKLPKAETTFIFETKSGTIRKAPSPDTLWLFPNERTGLLLWHAVAECANEAGEGVDIARAELTIDGKAVALPTQEEKAAPEPKEAPRAAKESAGISAPAAGAAAAGGAAVAAYAEADEKQETQKRADEAPAEEAQPGKEAAPAAMPEPQESAISAGELKAAMHKEFNDSLPEINAALAEAGLPPLSPEQVEETRSHIDRLSQAVADINAKAEEAKPPTLDESLKRIGASDAQIAAVKSAIDIPVPNISDFTDQAAWNAAAEAYADQFGAAIGADEKVVSSMKGILSSLPVGKAEEEAVTQGSSECFEQLVKIGMEPAAAARFAAALEEDVPSDPKELLKYAAKLEDAAGFPKGSVSGGIERVQKKMEELGIPLEGGEQEPALIAAAAGAGAAGAAAASAEGAEAASAAAVSTEGVKAAAAPEAFAAEAAVKNIAGAQLTRESIAELIAAGEALAGLTLDGLDLSGMDFSGRELSGASFVGAKLDGARFDGAALAGADFTEASLKGASFVGANLDKANLSSVRAEDADFSEALLSGAKVSGASLCGATISRADARGLSASGADLSRARVSFSDVSGADFSGAKMEEMDFHESKADGANFAKAALGGSTFCWGSSAGGCDFSGASLDGANWTRCRFDGSDFSDVSAQGASFTDCGLASSRWDGASARGGDFSRSALDGASMRGMDLFKGSLREARLFGADLSKSSLFGADLCRIFTDGATKLSGADCGETAIEAKREA